MSFIPENAFEIYRLPNVGHFIILSHIVLKVLGDIFITVGFDVVKLTGLELSNLKHTRALLNWLIEVHVRHVVDRDEPVYMNHYFSFARVVNQMSISPDINWLIHITVTS